MLQLPTTVTHGGAQQMNSRWLQNRILGPAERRAALAQQKRPGLISKASAAVLLLSALLLGWSGLSLAFPEPTNVNRQSYNYAGPDFCPTCHFIDGYDHTARAAGVQWNSTTNLWERTGHGWWDSHHAQSQYGWSNPTSSFGWTQPSSTYGENDNTFCTYCHSPLEASASGPSESDTTGSVVGGQPVTQFEGVVCGACHASSSIAGAIAKAYPGAEAGGELGILLRGQNPALATSWIGLMPGQENDLCLSCHQQDPHNAASNSIFQVMYNAGVRCIDCHMAPYQIFTGTATKPAPPLPERFHDWKVAENLPYSCGAQGSLPQYTCHSEFTAASAQAFIPVLTQQHSDWWNLPPFTSTDPSPAVSAHALNAPSDYLNLWQQIQNTQLAGR